MADNQNVKDTPSMKLYLKVSAEQEKYREWLKEQTVEEILHHVHEYIVREDIVFALESYELPEKQCEALLKSECPLEDLFREFEKRETGYMDDIRDTIECRANRMIREDFLRDQRKKNVAENKTNEEDRKNG